MCRLIYFWLLMETRHLQLELPSISESTIHIWKTRHNISIGFYTEHSVTNTINGKASTSATFNDVANTKRQMQLKIAGAV